MASSLKRIPSSEISLFIHERVAIDLPKDRTDIAQDTDTQVGWLRKTPDDPHPNLWDPKRIFLTFQSIYLPKHGNVHWIRNVYCFQYRLSKRSSLIETRFLLEVPLSVMARSSGKREHYGFDTELRYVSYLTEEIFSLMEILEGVA
jgi:hypothetical protein